MNYDVLKKSLVATVSAFVLTASLSGAASASTITADYEVGPNVYANITSSSQGRLRVLAARFNMETTDGDSFYAFCVDLAHHIADGVTYTVETMANSGFTQTTVTDIDRLFTSAYSTLGGNNTRNAGFQLALWEIIDETAGNAYDLSSGLFAVTSNAAAQGQNFLDNLGTATGGYELSFLDTPTNQSLVSADFEDVSAVPVPAGLPLLLTGLGGMAYLRRKSKNKTA